MVRFGNAHRYRYVECSARTRVVHREINPVRFAGYRTVATVGRCVAIVGIETVFLRIHPDIWTDPEWIADHDVYVVVRFRRVVLDTYPNVFSSRWRASRHSEAVRARQVVRLPVGFQGRVVEIGTHHLVDDLHRTFALADVFIDRIQQHTRFRQPAID